MTRPLLRATFKAFSPFQTSRTTDTLMVLEPGSRVRHTICASHNYTEPNSFEDEFRPVKLNQLLQAEDPSPSGGLRLGPTKPAHRARPYLAPTAIGGLRPFAIRSDRGVGLWTSEPYPLPANETRLGEITYQPLHQPAGFDRPVRGTPINR